MAERAVAIVVPVHGHAELSRSAVQRLLEDAETRDAEIVVVDDASPDDTVETLRGFGEVIRLVALETNRGFAAACNAGARAAGPSEFLLFLNNDIVATPGWLTTLLDYARAREHVAVVGSKLLFENGTVQHAGVVICTDRIARPVYIGFPGDHPAVSRSRRFQVVTAACTLVRRDVFERIGGFDDAFVNGQEDVDLCLRIGAEGYEVHYCAESVLYHFESMSREVTPATEVNRRLYQERWGASVVPDELATYFEDGLLAIERRAGCPFRLSVDPLLATVDHAGRALAADRLLDERTKQVGRLMRETIQLRVRLGELPELRDLDA